MGERNSELKFTILGCGSSAGVPRPNGNWGDCDPENPKNFRSRAALLIEKISEAGRTSIVVDTGPDFRTQMLAANVHHIDAVIYTHAHADHIHGIDDLRSFVQAEKHMMPIYADRYCQKRLNEGFSYCFKTPEGSNYPPILQAHEISAYHPFIVSGAGGEVEIQPFWQMHGDIHTLGLRIGKFAYATDVSAWPRESLEYLSNLDALIIGALQYEWHPSHFSLAQALEQIAIYRPKQAYLTHMHIWLDYDTVMRETPDNVAPAYDGLSFSLPCA